MVCVATDGSLKGPTACRILCCCEKGIRSSSSLEPRVLDFEDQKISDNGQKSAVGRQLHVLWVRCGKIRSFVGIAPLVINLVPLERGSQGLEAATARGNIWRQWAAQCAFGKGAGNIVSIVMVNVASL